MLKVDRRVKVVLAVHGLYTFCLQLLSSYNVLFAQALGASGADIGLLNSITAAAIIVSSPFVGLAIEKYSIKRIMLLGFAFDAAAMSIFIFATDWRMLIPAFVMFWQIIRQEALADMIFVTLLEYDKRGTVMSVARLFWTGLSLFAPLVAAEVVTFYGGINAQGIRPLYYIALAILLLLLIIVPKGLGEITAFKSHVWKEASTQRKSIIGEYREFFKGEKHLKRWVVLRLFKSGFSSLLSMFTPLWLVNVKGATAATLGILSAASTASAMLTQIPAGRMADKIGRKKTFVLFDLSHCLGIVALIFAPNTEYLVLASVLGGVGTQIGGSGGIGGVAFIPLIAMWWEAVPAESRGKLYGVEGLTFASSRIPTSIIGGILWNQGFMEHILLMPVLVEILIVMPILYTIPERIKPKKDSEVHG